MNVTDKCRQILRYLKPKGLSSTLQTNVALSISLFGDSSGVDLKFSRIEHARTPETFFSE